jgi:hypothetical protein
MNPRYDLSGFFVVELRKVGSLEFDKTLPVRVLLESNVMLCQFVYYSLGSTHLAFGVSVRRICILYL